MYKLFLCLRYLRRRYLALIAVLAVALCVMMVLIVVSVMDGFLRKVEDSAKGLFGEIVIDADSLSGIARYDEFISFLMSEVEEVQAATPVIYTYGLLRIGDTYTLNVQVCGIRLPERLAVTDFREGLFAQSGRRDASFDPAVDLLIDRTREHLKLIESLQMNESAKPAENRDAHLLNKLNIARSNASLMLDILVGVSLRRRNLEMLGEDLRAERGKPPDRRDEEKVRSLRERIERESARLDSVFGPPGKRVILGLGLGGLSFKMPSGQTIRMVSPGRQVVIALLPIGRGRLSPTVTPNTTTFTVVDDARTGVYSFDSLVVYVPFETLQELTDMGEWQDVDDPSLVDPARCSQIQIKVKAGFGSGRRLMEVRRKVGLAWEKFVLIYPDAGQARVSVQTWREKLDKYVGAIEKQRTLVTIMFGIISFVSVLLIFAIFYMIVTQKTRDIGLVRAVGGSAVGIARIFLAFGAATGAAGSALGITAGYFFVRHINEIQDWLAAWSGYRVWDRDVFLFDKIPNEVDPAVAAVIAVWAICSGLIGALIPSVKAALMEPAEAIRYE